MKALSELNSQQDASSQKTQDVENSAPGESAPKKMTYEDFVNPLEELEKQITHADTSEEDEIHALEKKVADLEAEIAKKAGKKSLSKKASVEVKKAGQEPENGKVEDDEIDQMVQAQLLSSMGPAVADEIRDSILQDEWFKDFWKARKELIGFH